jgi:hypothetical protein
VLTQPNGFINVKLSSSKLISSLAAIVSSGVSAPRMAPLKVFLGRGSDF